MRSTATTALVIATLLATAWGKEQASISSAENVGTNEPCGNPLVGEPPYCPTCRDSDDNHFFSTVGTECGVGIRSYNGNAQRAITDLGIAGSVGGTPLEFTRYSSTRLSSRNLAHSAFGPESPWSHNYEYVLRDSGGTVDRPIVKLTYPNGAERSYQRASATSTSWLPTRGGNPDTNGNPDRIITSGDDFVLHRGDLTQIHFKKRYHSVTNGAFYRLEALKDTSGNTTTISYLDNDDTLIRQITDPAGNWIKLHYQDLAIRANASTTLAEQLLPTGSTNVWKEITLTPGQSFRILALYQGNTWRQKTPLRVAELEFYDQNNVKITGTAFGSWPWTGTNTASKAFDTYTSTYYEYQYEKAGYVGLDLGAGNAKQVSRIRYRLTGTLNSDASVSFVGMNNPLVPSPAISHVEGSDGRQIGFDYDVYTEPSGIFQWAQLKSADYPDTTTAAYTYKWQHRHVMPVLETARDPRLSGSVKHIRYGYDLNNVVGFVVDAYDHATGQSVASVRWDDGHKPKLVHANGKVNRFEYVDGKLKRAVNSFGGATDYTHTASGFVLSEDDPLGRLTQYTRRSDGRLMSITTPAGSVTTYTRDTAGYIMSVNRNGKTTSHLRDAQRRITRTNHPDGTFETWTYNSYGQKLTHRLRNNTTQSWNYSPTGLLLSHTDPTGIVTTYTYNALNRLASETRGVGTDLEQTTSYLYNDRGQITRTTYADNTFTEHVYDTNGNRVGSIDERGILTTRTYDSLGRLLTETTASGTAKAQTTSYDYTSSVGGGCGCNTGGLPVTITYPDGTVTLNTYDKEWRLLSTTHAFGTAYAATTSHTYDVAGQKLSTTDPLGRVTTYAYDLDGRLISETRAANTGIAVTTTRTYSVDGNLLSVTEALGTTAQVTTAMTYDNMDRMVTRSILDPSSVILQTSSFAYNNLGQRFATTDPLNRTTTYTYDTFGRPQDTILPDGTIFRTEYDALSRPFQSIAALGLPEQAITSTTYDNRDRTITQTDPTGVTTTSAYWAGGLLKSVTTGAGRKVEYYYDENDNRTHVVTAPGTAEQTTTVTVYNNMGRPVTSFVQDTSSLIHHNSSFTYDPLGRTLTVRDHLNNTTTYTYDKVGNLLTTKAADNVVTSTRSYDALNRMTSDKDGKNQTISYAYDALGRMTSYTDAKGATFSFGYDLLGRQILRTEPDTTWQSYTYDVAGRLLVHRKADGKTKTHIYGNAQRDFLTQVNYSNGEPARLMEYDRLGRLTKASNGSSMVTRFYDEAGRLTGETQALTGGPTGSFVYEYNYATDDGNLASHTRPDGSHIDYAWNARNLLTGITSDAPPPVATYSYNARNQIASTIIESGLFTATRSYDAAGRLTAITNGTLDSTGYTLSPDGRRETITRNGDTEAYGYDNARQVTSGTYGSLSTTQSWNYDPAGNRLSAVTNGATTTYQANAVNEYFSITGGGHVPPAPTYDDNGNATTWNVAPLGSSSLVSSVFDWNINNELSSATNSTGDVASYAYDALGRRVKRTETIGGTTTTTWFFYNGWNVELEHNGTAYARRHTWGLDLSGDLQGAGGVGGLVMVEHVPPLPLGTEPSGEIPEGSKGGGEGASGQAEAYFPTYDGNGNITAWADANGTVVARQRYDAFGNILSQTGTAPSNYAFSTKPQERVTALYYYGYRYLDPVTGRWINRDPIQEDGGVNLYAFITNGGIDKWDYLGQNAMVAPCPESALRFLGRRVVPKFIPGVGLALLAVDLYLLTQWACNELSKQCEKTESEVELKRAYERPRGGCKSGVWMVGNCGRAGPVKAGCQWSPFGFGATRGQAQSASLAALPKNCWDPGVSYHHCTAYLCVRGRWERRM